MKCNFVMNLLTLCLGDTLHEWLAILSDYAAMSVQYSAPT